MSVWPGASVWTCLHGWVSNMTHVPGCEQVYGNDEQATATH